MIGLDTDVLVRYLAQDHPGFVSGIVLCDAAWVLAECYGADRARIRSAIEGLLSSKQIAVEAPDVVRKALRTWGESAAEFAGALIGAVAAAQGAVKTVTFDRAAAKLPGFELL